MTATKRTLKQKTQRAARGIWHAATENGMGHRWLIAASLCAIWALIWWALAWWVLPLGMPRIARFGLGVSVMLAIFWFVGPLRYSVRYLVADFLIWRRNKRTKREDQK